MKIGLLKETKTPVDNRVALSPEQVAKLNERYADSEIVVQSSDIRAFSDDEYRRAGIKVVDDVSDCDVLFGIKEARIDTLLPGKHYVFFGHIAKMQAYNRPLLQAFMAKGITFTDYEYLVDEKGIRVCAFGWWAGVVGVYYTLRGYGLRTGAFSLPKPDITFTIDELIQNLRNIELPKVKMLVTGMGRVSKGAQHVLEQIGAKHVSQEEYLRNDDAETLTYCVADADKLVRRTDGGSFTWDDFTKHPKSYASDFMRWAKHTDILLCAHFWAPDAPVYLSEEDLRSADNRIRFIGDVTCDIMGSVKSTLRSSTHAEPYYDYNPLTGKEEPAFSSDTNITVEAVDTCPNALPSDASRYFGDMLTPHVFEPLLTGKGESSRVINDATIVKDGKLTPKFAYLADFAAGK